MKIVSGGQTGVDRTALEIAIQMNMQHGGWCPNGRRAEDGVIPDHFQLQETESKSYSIRTRKNIVDSDGTIVFHGGSITGGTALTCRLAKSIGKPIRIVDISLAEQKFEHVVSEVADWISSNQIFVLNIAGPRLSSAPELPTAIRPYLTLLFQKLLIPRCSNK